MARQPKQQIVAMAAEFFREFALLIAVFVPLDVVVSRGGLTPRQIGGTFAVVAVMWTAGAYLGVERDE